MTRWTLVAAVVAASCAGPPAPAQIAMGWDVCAYCRMAIVSQATAGQIVAPGEEPQFFDEIGCLRDYLRRAVVPRDAMVYVADHRTGAWVTARGAVFTQTSTSTPMTSGLLAHADAASRDADPAAQGGSPTGASAILGPPDRSTTP